MGKNIAFLAVLVTAGFVLAVAAKRLAEERCQREDADDILEQIDSKLAELERNGSARAAVQTSP
ncbi:MAG TPA: hypothetical protein PLO61_10970 [Fimbriimonadaceae bacterium]|nr:hypothetical protein [Fimbriimonadaceae bacterium]HRJ32130.1 hypothetical protein [Fimbriimonadaceae bacterium]